MIAVIDIGKTNKKVTVFDDRLEPVEHQETAIGEEVVDGVRCERLAQTIEFTFGSLAESASRHQIAGVAVTAHGGTWVGLDARGEVTLPVLWYNNEPSDDVRQAAGLCAEDSASLYAKTATPLLPAMLNMALSLAWARSDRSTDYSRTVRILNLPNYIGYLLTGKQRCELTYLGCHTFLWDYAQWWFSSVADCVGYSERAPGYPAVSRYLFGGALPVVRLGLRAGIPVHLGLHDSNASLAPYLRAKSDVVVVSTGTWCVAMRPGVDPVLSHADQIRRVLLNIDVDGRPVRTSIYQSGAVYAAHVADIDGFADRSIQPRVEPDPARRTTARALLATRTVSVILPGLEGVIAAGPTQVRLDDGKALSWPDAMRIVEDCPPATAQSLLSALRDGCDRALAERLVEQMEAVGFTNRTVVRLEGPFRNNGTLVNTLRERVPENRVEVAPDELGTARGAASLVKDAIARYHVQ